MKAFEEGFADFYPVLAAQQTAAAVPAIYGVGNSTVNVLTYDSAAATLTADWTLNVAAGAKTIGYGAAATTGDGAVGEDDEGSVAGILLGLLNGYAAPTGQTIQLGIGGIEDLLAGTQSQWGVSTLNDLWNKLDNAADFTPTEIAAAGALFQNYGVSVVPAGLGAAQLTPGGAPPTLTWTVPQSPNAPAGGPAALMNAFTVEFLDANSNVITIQGVSDQGFNGASATLNNAGVFVGGQYIQPLNSTTPNVTTVSWQPTPQQWAAIAAADPAYWIVVSRDWTAYFPNPLTAPTNYPDTGDYWGAPQTISILPAPQVGISVPDYPDAGPAIAQITIPYTINQPLTVNYTIYTQTLTTEPVGEGYIATGSGTISQAGSGSVTIPAGDDEEDATLPGTYDDPSQPLVTLIVVSLPGETVPDSAAVAGANPVVVGNSEDQAWPIYFGTDENVSVTATTPTTAYGGAPGVVQFARSGDTSMPMLITPWGGTTGDDIVSSEDGVSMPGAEESGQTALYFPPDVATTDVDVTATAASTYAGGDYCVEIGGGGETNGDGFDSATITAGVPAVPTVSISGGGTIDEAWGSTYLTISRTGPTTASLPAYFYTTGTADEGQDYFTLPGDPDARSEAAQAFSVAAVGSPPGTTWPGGYAAQRAAETCYAIAL